MMFEAELSTVAEFIAAHPRLSTPAGARDQCRIAVQNALQIRATTGEPWVPNAREVWLIGHRRQVPINPARPPARTEAEHAVLCIGGRLLVDLTRKQYDPEAPTPLIYYSIDEAGRDWRWFIDEASPDGARRELPLR